MNVDLINKINDSPYKAFFAISGGGQSFIGDFTKISGASKTFIGAIVPYNQMIFDNFIGKAPDQYVSSEAARKLAINSYQQCLLANISTDVAVGIGATSAIASGESEREGRKHKIYIAAHALKATWLIEIILNQGRTRIEEDALISNLILKLLSLVTLGNSINVDIDIFNKNGEIGNLTWHFDQSIRNIYAGLHDIFCTKNLIDIPKICIFPGSFNLLHDGHIKMAEIAQSILNIPIIFEISIKNADKGYLDYIEVQSRQVGMLGYDYMLTSASTFKEKVNLIKKYSYNAEIVFVIGADTWIRIWDAKYGISLHELEKFFEINNVKFLVFGRNNINIDSTYLKFIVPSNLASDFNMPISSTELRKLKNSI